MTSILYPNSEQTMAGMFAAMALAPVVSQFLSQAMFGNQGGSGSSRHAFPKSLPENRKIIGLPNHLPSGVYMSLQKAQAGSGRRRVSRRRVSHRKRRRY